MLDTNFTQHLPIVPTDILDRFHANESFDTRFSSCARVLQSIWRDRRGFPVGVIAPKDGPPRRCGSRLTPAVAQRGFNFLTPDIAKLVRQEAAYREYGAMFEEERLWGNLLSSQPLVFNLFGQAKLDPDFGTELFRTLLPDFVAELETIYFETSPGRGDERFTGDRTAFDLVAVITTIRGTPGFVGIEVKFAESMSYRAQPTAKRFNELADGARVHRDPHANALREAPLERLFRLHLLSTAIIAETAPYKEGMFVLIAPEANRDATRAASAYRRHLRQDPMIEFRHLPLESCIHAVGRAGERDLSAALHERYANFDPVHELVADWEPHQPATPE